MPVLLDWTQRDAPLVEVLYWSQLRRTVRVRLFVDFATQLFRELEAERGDTAATSWLAQRPRWWARTGRASVALREST